MGAEQTKENGARMRGAAQTRSEAANQIQAAGLQPKGEKGYIMKLNEQNLIGEGNYAMVYKIKRKDNNQVYAAKILKMPIFPINFTGQLSNETELTILKRTNHPFVIKFIEEFIYQQKQCIVTEYIGGGALELQIRRNFKEDQVLSFLTMLLLSVQHLHNQDIIHRNLKPANILIDELQNGFHILKIFDFGVSYCEFPGKNRSTLDLDFMGARAYQSPESIDRVPSTTKVDIWGIGIILYQLLSKGKHPFQKPDEWDLSKVIKAIREEQPQPLPETVSPFMRGLVNQLLDKNPETRPDALTLLSIDQICLEAIKIQKKVAEASREMGTQLQAQIIEIQQFQIRNSLQRQLSNNENQDLFFNQSQCAIDPLEKAVMKKLLLNKNLVTTLKYRGSEHGWTAQDFYSKASNIGASILLMKLKDGPCIGGFTQAKWKQTNDPISISDSSAMIFNLTNYQQFPVKIHQRAITCFKSSICFGDEEIKISEPFNQENNCKSWANNSVYCIKEETDGKNFLTQQRNEHFTITQIEVWQVTGDLPHGQFGVQSQFMIENPNSERWRSYQILLNAENKLGDGQYGDVYRIKEKKSLKVFAAKFLKVKIKFMFSPPDLLSLQRELESIKKCNHPFVNKFIEEFEYEEKQCLVMQYASGGTLKHLMKKQQVFSEEELMNYLIMMLFGLQYLQVNGIMHRDLNPNNILVDLLPNGFKILQITDFGLSKNSKKHEVQSETLANLTTKAYIAPEVVKGGASTTQVDMWALGIIFFELTANTLPFQKGTEQQLLNAITDENPAELPPSVPPLLSNIIYALLDKNPETRPDATKLLSLPEVKEAAQRLHNQIREVDPEMAQKIFEEPKKFK